MENDFNEKHFSSEEEKKIREELNEIFNENQPPIRKLFKDPENKQQKQKKFLGENPKISEFLEKNFSKIQDSNEFHLFCRGIMNPLKNKIEKIIQEEEKEALEQYQKAEENDGGSDHEDEYEDILDPENNEEQEYDEENIFENEEMNNALREAYKQQETGDEKNAKIIFENLFNKEPRNVELWHQMIEFYIQEFPEEIFDFCDEIEEIYTNEPDNTDFVFALCEIFSEMKYYSEWGKDFQKLYQTKYPFYKKKVFEQVEKDEEKTLNLLKLYTFQQAGIIDNNDDPNATYKTLEKLVQHKPKEIIYLIHLCDMHLERGFYKKAFTLWEKAKKIAPQHEDVLRLEQDEFLCNDFSPDHIAITGDVLNQIKYDEKNKEPEMYNTYKNNKKNPVNWARNN